MSAPEHVVEHPTGTVPAIKKFADICAQTSQSTPGLVRCDVDSWILSNEAILKLLESQEVDLTIYDYPNILQTGNGPDIAAGELLKKLREDLGDATFQDALRAATNANPAVLTLGAQAANRFIEENGLKRGDLTTIAAKHEHRPNPIIIGAGSYHHHLVGGLLGREDNSRISDDLELMYPHVVRPLVIPTRSPADTKVTIKDIPTAMMKLIDRGVPRIKQRPETEDQQG